MGNVRIWTNARLVTLATDRSGLGLIEDGEIHAENGKITFAGPRTDAPKSEGADRIDCSGRWITPGLIDCHTHLIYAGNRAPEFEQRLAGASYEEIARAGGGIRSTMKATRSASVDELVELALPRLDALLAEGVSIVEIKSGYGLNLEAELRQLEAARALAAHRGVKVRTTLLAAHSLPPEYDGRPDDYITLVCEEIIPEAARQGLADAVDAYCDNVGFTRAQTERVFVAAEQAGLPIKLHAEQFSNLDGTALAAAHGALSADHLEYVDEAGGEAMAKAGTTAVLLPGAFYFLRETQLPPVDLLRQLGVPIALSTDCNPGSSPLTSLLLTMNMGATLFRLTVEECLRGVTLNAARALGMADEAGSLEAGKRCDLAIWDVETPAELVYHIGLNRLHSRVWNGQ